MAPMHLTHPQLQTLFTYDPRTGQLRWRDALPVRASLWGRLVGAPDRTGYRRVMIDGHRYAVHRLIWFMYYGVDPDYMVMHVNGNRADNRIKNLAPAKAIEHPQRWRPAAPTPAAPPPPWD